MKKATTAVRTKMMIDVSAAHAVESCKLSTEYIDSGSTNLARTTGVDIEGHSLVTLWCQRETSAH